MSIRGYLWRFSKGDPVAKVCNTTHHNRVAQILEDIVGVGLRIEKNTDGSPWRIIYDGVTSDEKPADDSAPAGGGGVLGFPWGSNYTFGITKTADDKLKVWNGKFRRWGDQVYVASDTEVTFGSDGEFYLVWRWSESSGLEIETTPRAVTSWPAESDSTYIYGVIHKVKLLSGAFTLLDAIQDGIINAPIFTVAGS